MNTPDYQVFISFKNTGATGKPTPDAAVARKVYEALRAAKPRSVQKANSYQLVTSCRTSRTGATASARWDVER